MRDFSDLDAYFGSGGGGGGGANPESWKRYAKPQQDPRFKSKAARPGEGPTNQAYDPSANVNQRAFQDNGYAKPAVSGDPETDKLLGEAQDTYFGPRLSLRDPNDQSGAPPQYTGEDQHPYFGQAEKPLNEGKDPAGHQALAAMPDGVADARRTYSDAVRGADADLNDAIRDANAPRHGLAGFLKRIGNDDMELEQQKAAKIANAQAIHQAKIAAANATYRAVLPQDFAAVVPGKDPQYDYNKETNEYFDRTNPRNRVPGGNIVPNPRLTNDERKLANEEERIRLQAKRDADTAAYHDKWIGLQNNIMGARTSEDKAQAERRADREINSDIIKLESKKLEAVADAESKAQFSDDKDAAKRVASAYDALIEKARGMRTMGAAPTTSQPPPTPGRPGVPPAAAPGAAAPAAGGDDPIISTATNPKTGKKMVYRKKSGWGNP